MPDPQNLRELGKRLDEAQQRQADRNKAPPPTQMGIAFRFATELVVALLVGGAMGWGIDWLFGYFGIHTKPLFLIAMFVLGGAAGVRNVIRAAQEINAAMTGKAPAAGIRDDDEES
jgi:ATP synthase protein I